MELIKQALQVLIQQSKLETMTGPEGGDTEDKEKSWADDQDGLKEQTE